MSYYHGLGGYKNMVNLDILKDKEYYIKKLQIPENFMRTTEPISLYRLSNILKSKKIKCKNHLPLDIDNYDYNGYDKDSIYLSYPNFSINKEQDNGFEDWAGVTISLKFKDILKKDFKLLNPFLHYRSSGEPPITVNGEVRIKNEIPISYVESICVPIYTEILYLLTSCNRKIGNSASAIYNSSYFIDKQNQINVISKILEDEEIDIPIEETYTEQPLTDISSIIEELDGIPSISLPEYVENKKLTIYRSLYPF